LCCLAGFKQLRLKDLNLAYCHTLAASEETFAILSEIPTLTTLSLQGCNITQLSEGIGGCKALKELGVFGCDSLASLPPSIGGCTALQELDLGWCRALESLPNTIGALKSLETLDCQGCKKLESIPNTIGELKSLENLDCYGCAKLEYIPNSLVQQLKSQGCKILR